jgi:hypothetical protein
MRRPERNLTVRSRGQLSSVNNFDLRASPWFGPGHCRKGNRQSHRANLVRAMMLRHFGEGEAADAIERAIEDVLATPEFRTPDVGGKATTEIVGKAIAAKLAK